MRFLHSVLGLDAGDVVLQRHGTGNQNERRSGECAWTFVLFGADLHLVVGPVGATVAGATGAGLDDLQHFPSAERSTGTLATPVDDDVTNADEVAVVVADE